VVAKPTNSLDKQNKLLKFEPFARLAWTGIVSFTLDTKSVDGATSRQQDSEMSGVATIARKGGSK
jgi:hypothetical protein